MNNYKVFFKKSAEKELRRLPIAIIKRIYFIIEDLKKAPVLPQSRKILGQVQMFRIRTGDYRIVYTVDTVIRIICIIKIGHRKDVYRGL